MKSHGEASRAIRDPRAMAEPMKENREVSERILRMPDVVKTVGLCRASIYNRMKSGTFPKQVKLGRLSGWLESEIQGWIRAQTQASRPDQAGQNERHAHAA